MTSVTTPELQRHLLVTVGEAVAKDSPGETIRLGVGIVREVRESVARIRQELEDELARGVEPRSFAASHGPVLRDMDEHQVHLKRLLGELAGTEGSVAEPFIAELRLLETEAQAYRDRLAEALSLASKPPGPVDWERLKEEADADFAAGRFTTFVTPEDMAEESERCQEPLQVHKGVPGTFSPPELRRLFSLALPMRAQGLAPGRPARRTSSFRNWSDFMNTAK